MALMGVGRHTCAFAIEQDWTGIISVLTGVDERSVKKRLRAVRGNTLLRNAFADEWPETGDALGGWTVSDGRTFGLEEEIAAATGLSGRSVVSRLKKESGNKLLKNAFPEMFADDIDDGDDEGDVGDNGESETDDDHEVAAVSSPYIRVPSTNQDNTAYALVIGNQDYRHDTRLANPRKDASDFADLMRKLGHETDVHFDLTLRQMDAAVSHASSRLVPGRGVVFYYSGHGAECNDDNWLIPIDCNSEGDDDLERQAKSLRKVHKALGKARFRVTILDACRSNPFRGLSRGDGARGLGQVEPANETPEGDYICYATGPRQVASDGKRGENGLFTAALLRHFQTPGAHITDIMRRVRKEVSDRTSGKQFPWAHDGLTAEWYPRLR